MLLVYRSITVIVSVLCPGVRVIGARKARIAPGCPVLSRGKGSKVGVDPDRHDRRFAAAVHDFGVRKRRWACLPLKPDKRTQRSFGLFFGGRVRCEIV